jgi:hypothetical protein
MDLHQFLLDFNALGPALAAVLVIGVVCYFLLRLLGRVLDMFEKHTDAIQTMGDAMQDHSHLVKGVEKSIEANTIATEKLHQLIERSIR